MIIIIIFEKMKYKLYTSSKKAWQGMIEEIRKAQKSIYIEMYIFLNDTSDKYDFFGALKERADNGVQVIIVMDYKGSFDLKKSAIDDLKKHGIEVLFFSHWLRRTHRKITIIDNKVTFIGGVNIKRTSSEWLDLQIKLKSKLLIKNILRSFAYTYQMSGGKNKKILQTRERLIFKTIKTQFLEHWPNRNIYFLKKYYQDKLLSAQRKIVIVTPYFFPPRWLMALLDVVIKKGVRIEIFIPRDTDIKLLNRTNRIYVNELSNLKINFYAQNKMNHAKVLLIDNEEALIGSQNLDIVSFYINLESGVSITNKNLIEDLNKIIKTWKRGSIKFPKIKKKLSIWDRIILGIIKFFYSIL